MHCSWEYKMIKFHSQAVVYRGGGDGVVGVVCHRSGSKGVQYLWRI